MRDSDVPPSAAGVSGTLVTAALAEATGRLEEAVATLDGLDRRVGELLHAVDALHAAADAAQPAKAAERALEPEPAPGSEPAAASPAVPRRRSRRPGLVPAILFTVGAVAVADAVVTVVWQEPFSRLYASRQQSELRGELQTLERQAVLPAVRLPAAPAPAPGDRMAELAAALSRKADPGSAVGRVSIPSLGVRFVMVQGTGEGSLRRGPGHYAGTALPGQHGTVGLAGHRTTYLAPFRRINELGKGAAVRLEMPYGTFDYRVVRTRVVSPSQASVLDATSHDQVVLTACHPLYSAAKRIVVTARLVRAVPKGPAVSRAGGAAAAAPPRPA